MKIEGLPQNAGGVNTVTGKKLPKSAAAASKSADADFVAISGAGTSEQTELAASIPEEIPVRTDALGAVTERISQDYYNSSEAQEATAERIIDSLDISASVITMQNGSTEEDVRANVVESAKSLAASGGYDTPETMNAVAERLASALGLTGILG